MKLSQLKIDPEFQSKIPPLQFEEEQQLEQNIIAEGRLLNPIITWNGYILDGHTRYRILKKHGFIKFEVEEIQLANKYEALAWICKNQLGRRNLSPERKKFLLGKEYESTKLAVGGQPGNCNKVNRCDQNDHIDIEPTSNAPPSFLQSIQGHKRHLSEEDKARLKASVDARYKDKAAATGSIMLCELQGATEEFIFRWNVIFQEHPDVLTDKTCRKTIFELLDRMTNYLKTIKEEKL